MEASAGKGLERRALPPLEPTQRISNHAFSAPLHKIKTEDLLPNKLLTPFQEIHSLTFCQECIAMHAHFPDMRHLLPERTPALLHKLASWYGSCNSTMTAWQAANAHQQAERRKQAASSRVHQTAGRLLRGWWRSCRLRAITTSRTPIIM